MISFLHPRHINAGRVKSNQYTTGRATFLFWQIAIAVLCLSLVQVEASGFQDQDQDQDQDQEKPPELLAEWRTASLQNEQCVT